MTLTTTNYGKKTFGKPEQHQTVRDYPDEHQAMKAAHGNMRAFIGKKGPSDRSAQAQHQAKPHATESHKRSLANLGKKPTRAAEHTTVLNENRLRKHQPGRKFNAGDLSSSPVNKYTGKTSAQELADAKLRGHKFPRGKSYEEGKHPRAQGGKWTGGSGEGSDGGRASTSEHRHEPIKTSPPDNREGDHSKKMDAQYHAEMSKAPKKDDFFKPAGKASGTIHNDPDPVEPDGKLSRMDGKKGGKGGFRATGATPTIKRKPTGKNGIQPLKKKKP